MPPKEPRWKKRERPSRETPWRSTPDYHQYHRETQPESAPEYVDTQPDSEPMEDLEETQPDTEPMENPEEDQPEFMEDTQDSEPRQPPAVEFLPPPADVHPGRDEGVPPYTLEAFEELPEADEELEEEFPSFDITPARPTKRKELPFRQEPPEKRQKSNDDLKRKELEEREEPPTKQQKPNDDLQSFITELDKQCMILRQRLLSFTQSSIVPGKFMIGQLDIMQYKRIEDMFTKFGMIIDHIRDTHSLFTKTDNDLERFLAYAKLIDSFLGNKYPFGSSANTLPSQFSEVYWTIWKQTALGLFLKRNTYLVGIDCAIKMMRQLIPRRIHTVISQALQDSPPSDFKEDSECLLFALRIVEEQKRLIPLNNQREVDRHKIKYPGKPYYVWENFVEPTLEAPTKLIRYDSIHPTEQEVELPEGFLGRYLYLRKHTSKLTSGSFYRLLGIDAQMIEKITDRLPMELKKEGSKYLSIRDANHQTPDVTKLEEENAAIKKLSIPAIEIENFFDATVAPAKLEYKYAVTAFNSSNTGTDFLPHEPARITTTVQLNNFEFTVNYLPRADGSEDHAFVMALTAIHENEEPLVVPPGAYKPETIFPGWSEVKIQVESITALIRRSQELIEESLHRAAYELGEIAVQEARPDTSALPYTIDFEDWDGDYEERPLSELEILNQCMPGYALGVDEEIVFYQFIPSTTDELKDLPSYDPDEGTAIQQIMQERYVSAKVFVDDPVPPLDYELRIPLRATVTAAELDEARKLGYVNNSFKAPALQMATTVTEINNLVVDMSKGPKNHVKDYLRVARQNELLIRTRTQQWVVTINLNKTQYDASRMYHMNAFQLTEYAKQLLGIASTALVGGVGGKSLGSPITMKNILNWKLKYPQTEVGPQTNFLHLHALLEITFIYTQELGSEDPPPTLGLNYKVINYAMKAKVPGSYVNLQLVKTPLDKTNSPEDFEARFKKYVEKAINSSRSGNYTGVYNAGAHRTVNKRFQGRGTRTRRVATGYV